MNYFSPHLELLPAPQRALWNELSEISREFGLYGGTALALHLAHRKSVDFYTHRQGSLIRGRGLTGTPRWAVIRRHRCQNGSSEMTRLQQHCQGVQVKALMQIHHRAMISRRHGERVAKRGAKCVSNNLERIWRRLEGAHARTGARGTGPTRSNDHLRRTAIREGCPSLRNVRVWLSRKMPVDIRSGLNSKAHRIRHLCLGDALRLST